MNKVLALALSLFIAFPICAQEDYMYYFELAQSYFDKGEYAQAQKTLCIYTDLTKQSVPELERKISLCVSYSQFAEEAEKSARYENAIQFYNKILGINPKDPVVEENISRCRSLLEGAHRDKPSSQIPAKHVNLLKPYSSTFGVRILSSFDTKAPFGLGLYGNKSYFQFGVDIMVSHTELSDASYVDIFEAEGENSNSFYLIEESNSLGADGRVLAINREFAYPKFSLAMSPGINLKYFSVELGLGAYFCETYKITQQLVDSDGDILRYPDYDGEHKKKTYFFVRPTVVGYLPINNGGLQLSVGYNVVSGAKALNGFIVSIGCFASW